MPGHAIPVQAERAREVPEAEHSADFGERGLSLRTHRYGLRVTTLFFLVVAVLTFPKFPYPGDNFVPRIESIQLAKRGMLGIPFSMREKMSGLDAPRGQYFFSHDQKERFYSKYGIAYTIAYLPPVWAELAVNPEFDVNEHSQEYFLKQGFYLTLLGLLFVYYLYRLAALFVKSQWNCCFFTLVAIYSTFLWHYLRAPALEIFQLPAFAGACLHALAFLRRRRAGDDSVRCWLHLLGAVLWSGTLVLMRSNFVVLGFAVSAFPFFMDPDAPGGWKAPFVSLGRHWKRYAWSVIIPWAVIFALLLAFNHIKFGSVFDSGYMQWAAHDGTPATKFGISYFIPNLQRFFLRLSHDFNLFKAYPYALPGVLGFVFFARKWKMESAFILAVTLPGIVLLLVYGMADGQWCYGPRYFLYYAIMLALPFFCLFGQWLGRLRKGYRRAAVALFMVPVLYLSWQQFMVNSLHYFVSYQLRGVFRQTQHPLLIDYGGPRWKFCRDLFYYGRGWEGYYPLDVIRPLIPPEQEANWLQFKSIVDHFAALNLYFFAEESGSQK